MNPQAELIVLPRQTPLGPIAALLACVGWLWGGVSLRAADPFESAAISRATTWTNSLGMKLVPVRGTDVLFCVWETRVRDYAAFAGANHGVDGQWRNPGFAQGEDHPVVQVSWNDAQAFCRWLTEKERAAGFIDPSHRYRLPTDAEWSVAVGLNEPLDGTPAAKDGKIRGVYPWGTQWPPPDRAGNYDDHSGDKITGFSDGYPRTSPVGSFAANAFGLFDLGGNVWEWCEDGYDERQKSRVLRGASWLNYHPDFLLSSDRFYGTPVGRLRGSGFRCVLVAGGSAR
ncbi:MAG: formylglycine-generating enzyme family protein [Limisphaerales bacterium]